MEKIWQSNPKQTCPGLSSSSPLSKFGSALAMYELAQGKELLLQVGGLGSALWNTCSCTLKKKVGFELGMPCITPNLPKEIAHWIWRRIAQGSDHNGGQTFNQSLIWLCL
jgi:hypothetical protein